MTINTKDQGPYKPLGTIRRYLNFNFRHDDFAGLPAEVRVRKFKFSSAPSSQNGSPLTPPLWGVLRLGWGPNRQWAYIATEITRSLGTVLP